MAEEPPKRQTSIFIAGLDKRVSNKALHDTFARFGNVLSCNVSHKDERETGVGFVHFQLPEEAASAIEQTNQKQILDRTVTVTYMTSKEEREQNFKNIFIKNLPEDTTKEMLKEMCEKFGTVVDVTCEKAAPFQAKSHDKPVVRAYGFAVFEETESAQQAVEALNGSMTEDNQPLYAGRAQSKSEREARARRAHAANDMKNNLYVKNLDEEIDDEALEALFAEFGNVTSAKVARNDSDISRGFGFVSMSTPEEAQKAIEALHNKMIEGRPLYVAMHQSKTERMANFSRRQHAAIHGQGMNMDMGMGMGMGMGAGMDAGMGMNMGMGMGMGMGQPQYMPQMMGPPQGMPFMQPYPAQGMPQLGQMHPQMVPPPQQQYMMMQQMFRFQASNHIYNRVGAILSANPHGVGVGATAAVAGMILEQPTETLAHLASNDAELQKQVAHVARTLTQPSN